MTNKDRYTVERNEIWWAVRDTTEEAFAVYLDKPLDRCGLEEAHRLAKLLNNEIEPPKRESIPVGLLDCFCSY